MSLDANESSTSPQKAKRASDLADLAAGLVALGCPKGKSDAMARQLDKRAQQLAAQKETTYEEALAHLLELMRQGWSAKERGL